MHQLRSNRCNMSKNLEARGGIEPPIKVLQTFALPLGDRAKPNEHAGNHSTVSLKFACLHQSNISIAFQIDANLARLLFSFQLRISCVALFVHCELSTGNLYK